MISNNLFSQELLAHRSEQFGNWPMAMNMRVAALNRNRNRLDLLRHSMRHIGLSCETFERSSALRQAMHGDSFDLLVIDWQLPDVTAPEIIQWVRLNVDHYIPIVFVTDQGQRLVEGLTCGADDYMVDPSLQELKARVEAHLRRNHSNFQKDVCEWGPYRLNRRAHEIRLRGERLDLTRREVKLAWHLFTHLGRTLSRKYLGDMVLGAAPDVVSRTLDTHISRLRNALELRSDHAHGLRLVSEYGVGYRLERIDGTTDAAS